MRSRMHRSSRIGEIVTFWAIIIACSLVLSGLAFVGAKYWVGGLMAKSKATQSSPQVVLKTPDEQPEEDSDMGPERVNPPAQVAVKMQQRAPTDAEKSEIEQKYPQDAADLHEGGKPDATDDSTGSDDKALDKDKASGDQSGGGSRYMVVANSYRDEANARREAADLEGRGYNARIVEVTRDGQTFHRVVVAEFDERAEAEHMRDRLKGDGVAATIMAR
ncbi:MAG: SPOR domain-containing protein [Armatimonadetes bacterium]|nr:SPOR domain-containing protein [Armatimonadota bacterium]